MQLGLDRWRHKIVVYERGHVYWYPAGREREVIASPKIMREPGLTYFIDADGDLAVDARGTSWSPPLVVDRQIAAAPLPVFTSDPTLATTRFHKLPLPGPPMFESELLEPARALEVWQAASRRKHATGFTPLVRSQRFTAAMDSEWDAALVARNRKDVVKSTKLSVPKLLETRRRELAKNRDDLAAQVEGLARATLGAARAPASFYFEDDYQYVVVTLVGCPPSEILCWLGFGGGNDCPPAAQLAAVLGSWAQRFGTELVAEGADRLELRLEFPLEPRLRKELAWEQYLMADDVVHQGTTTLTALADELAAGRVFLWWD